ncbi:hypothetical protein HAX54_005309 [Datura stramonium]|uniref:EF-hand domain-containing protein n=1 Tax=Datura stramonium TaxID=4076 RepID=A0ABS8RUP3_DATST|nr:hypothetical protein [Datura stramonium]
MLKSFSLHSSTVALSRIFSHRDCLICLILSITGLLNLENLFVIKHIYPRTPHRPKIEFAFKLYDLKHTGFIERRMS